MRRRTTIVLAITFMVATLVCAFSYIYISQLLRQRVVTAHETAAYLDTQLAYLASNAAPDLTSTRVDTNDPEAVRRAVIYYLGTDRDLNTMMDSIVGSVPIIYDAAIVDADGNAILHTDPDLNGKPVPNRPDFQQVVDANFRQQLKLLYNSPTVYDVRVPLQLNGEPFGSIRVGVSTVFLKNELTPRLQHAVIFFAAAILFSLVLAAGLSHIALGPLERISRSLDSVTAGDAEPVAEPEKSSDEYGLVTLKIAHLGRQMRDAKEIFSALKDNVDQIMANLQDGLMLFTGDARVVLVSASVERFLGRPRGDLLGRTVKEIFSPDSVFGLAVLEGFRQRTAVMQREFESPNGKRVQVSLDFIQQEGGEQIGALLTMRDAESVRKIEDEATLAAPDAAQHSVALTRELPPDPLFVKVDTDFMKQAILNVVLNGVQAMPQGGTLAISARREDEVVITEIRDQGGGIPHEIQDKIFELYFTTKKGGSGIGLAQTYQILQWHYGSVDFESLDGQGAIFRLRLPVAETRAESLKETAIRT